MLPVYNSLVRFAVKLASVVASRFQVLSAFGNDETQRHGHYV